jgi:two-component system chemotaxis response regulator CheB
LIRVLVADDSRLVRAVLRELLEEDPGIRVVGEAEDGLQAVELCRSLAPDVVLMDVQMPVLDGLAAVERIMKDRPTPVIVLSATVHPGEVDSAFRAVRAGAFEALAKPEGLVSREAYARVAESLRSRVKLYARVAQRRGWSEGERQVSSRELPVPMSSRRVVAVGASAGGPRTVQGVLGGLPRAFPCPILLVQHISPGFTSGFAQWLSRETPFAVKVVEQAERLERGTVYLAVDGRHLVVRRGTAAVEPGPAENGCRPSVDVLFRSLAEECGSLGVAVLLTGMGRDGARGALAVRRAGGLVIAQDERSSTIFGMPKAAIELGAAHRVLSAAEIPTALVEAAREGTRSTAREEFA